MTSGQPTIDSLPEKGWVLADSQHAQLKAKELARELTTFLDRPPSVVDSELERAAHNRARAIINTLKQLEIQ